MKYHLRLILLVTSLVSSLALLAGAQDQGDGKIDTDFGELSPPSAVLEWSLEKLRRLVQQDPLDPYKHVALAKAAHFLRYEEEAIEAYQEALRLDPSSTEAHLGLGRIYASQKRNPDDAIEHLNTVIESDPDNISAREELACLYFRLQRYPRAREELGAILSRQPDDVLSMYRLAVIAHDEGYLDEARHRIKDILELDSDYEHALVLSGVLYTHSGEMDKARQEFERACSLYPGNMRARYELAKILVQERQFEKAEPILRAIVDEDPFHNHALFQLLRITLRKGDREAAEKIKASLDAVNALGRGQRNYYRGYLRHHPDTPETHLALARIYLEISRGNLAAKEFQVALQRDPANREALFLLGQVYMASEDYRKASEYLSRCLELQGDAATIHGLLAVCYLHLGGGAQARSHFDAAAKIDPAHPLVTRIRQMLKEQKTRENIPPEKTEARTPK
jgi:cytochrome c-type biogenesis protein CcmH/NrfG